MLEKTTFFMLNLMNCLIYDIRNINIKIFFFFADRILKYLIIVWYPKTRPLKRTARAPICFANSWKFRENVYFLNFRNLRNLRNSRNV